jgi:hypothetical protein
VSIAILATSAGLSVASFLRRQRSLNRERRPHRPLGIVLLGHRISEQRHQLVAELLGDFATHLRHCRRRGIEISANQIAPFFSVELRGDTRRIHQIAEHRRDVPALANGFWYRRASGMRSRQRLGCRSHSHRRFLTRLQI